VSFLDRSERNELCDPLSSEDANLALPSRHPGRTLRVPYDAGIDAFARTVSWSAPLRPPSPLCCRSLATMPVHSVW
jgi:hypothetical protein